MSALTRLWSALLRTYATADPRSLGLFRIALGTLLFYDVARRWPDLTAHFSNAGWLPNHFALYRPLSSHYFSVYLAASTPAEVHVFAALHLAVNLLLILGVWTKLMQVLAAVLITSLASRNVLLENGGWVVLNLLAVWSVFLPLGRRYSVDAWVAAWRARRDPTEPRRADTRPVVALAVTALLLQWSVIYFFNTVHKNGAPWKDGTAVYYFFQQDRMVTLLGAWVREVMPLTAMKWLTWSTLVIEGSLVVLLLTPVLRGEARKVAWFLIVALHLSIDATVQLGPFSWAMVIMPFVLVPSPEDWARIDAWLRRRRVGRRLHWDPASPSSVRLARAVTAFDTLGLVELVPFSAGPPPGVDAAQLGRALVVSDAAGETGWTGQQALVRLTDALPWPRPLGWLARATLGRLALRLAGDQAAADVYLGPEPPPAPVPPPALADARERAGHVFATALVSLLMLALGSQVLEENRAVPAPLKPKARPAWMTAVVVYPRLFQGWSMFAPAPPGDDGRLVIDGRTADGRKLDPLTGREPSFEVQPRDGFRMNQIWGDFHRRVPEPRFSHHLPQVRDMIARYHELSGRPADKLVAFDIWHVVEIIPPPGQPKQPASRRKLISLGVVRDPTP